MTPSSKLWGTKKVEGVLTNNTSYPSLMIFIRVNMHQPSHWTADWIQWWWSAGQGAVYPLLIIIHVQRD